RAAFETSATPRAFEPGEPESLAFEASSIDRAFTHDPQRSAEVGASLHTRRLRLARIHPLPRRRGLAAARAGAEAAAAHADALRPPAQGRAEGAFRAESTADSLDATSNGAGTARPPADAESRRRTAAVGVVTGGGGG